MEIDVILEGDAGPREVASLGRLADQYGIRAVWTSDYPAARDPFLALGTLAGVSGSIRMGPLAVNPFEMHPLKMAAALMTLNEITAGRANVLVGGGGGLSGTTGRVNERMVAAVGDCIEILGAAATGQRVDYAGGVYQARNFQLEWAAEQPRPLIYAAANKPQMLRMATRSADGVMVGDMTPAKLAEIRPIIEQGLADRDRRRKEFRISNFWAWHVKPNAEDAQREARQQLALRGMLNDWYLQPFMEKTELETVHSSKAAFFHAFSRNSADIEGVPEEIVDKLVRNLTCTGPVDELEQQIDRLREFQLAGLDELALRLHANPEHAIRLIGESVLPALR